MGAPLRNKAGHCARLCFGGSRDQRLEQIAFRAENANLIGGDFYPLRQRAEVIAAIAAILISHPFARGGSEIRQHIGRDRLPALSAERSRHALGVGFRLIARRLEHRYALLEVGVVDLGNSVLDGIVKSLQS